MSIGRNDASLALKNNPKKMPRAKPDAPSSISSTSLAQNTLDKFKEFFTLEVREKLNRLCEIEDRSKQGCISLTSFYKILEYMGAKLLLEEVKSLAEGLNVYSQTRDRIFST